LKKTSIYREIFIWFLLAGLLPAAIFGGIIFYMTAVSTEKQVSQYVSSFADEFVHNITQYFDEKKSVVKMFANLESFRKLMSQLAGKPPKNIKKES
jgi:hypothetical protein